MKLLLQKLVLALAVLSVQIVSAQPPSPPPALPANVKASLESALKAVNPSDSDAVENAVLAAIEKNPTLAPSIIDFAVRLIGQALINNPGAAEKVIPNFVLAAVKAQPSLMTQIIGAAVAAVPSQLKIPVVPRIIGEALVQTDDRKAQADILNAAYQAIGNDRDVVAALDKIALENQIRIVQSDNQQQTGLGQDEVRYFADEQLAETFFSGDQGTISEGGSVGGFGGSGGGSGDGGGQPASNDSSSSSGGSTPTQSSQPAPAPPAPPPVS